MKTWDYLERRTLPEVESLVPAGASLEYTYEYDAAGSVTDSVRTITGPEIAEPSVPDAPSVPEPVEGPDTTQTVDTLSHTFTYDNLGRLTQSEASDGETNAYGYDEAGNRTSWDVTGAAAGDSHLTAQFNAAGQLTSTKTTGVNAGSASYSFDGAGNRSSQTVNGVPTSFGHDAAGRLLSTQTEGRSTSYAYDGLDRRTSVTDETRFGSDTTGTTWDGLDPVATDSGLHGSTELLRDPTGEVVFQSGAYDDAWVLGDARNATATADAGGRITDLVDYADFGAAGFESTGWASLVGNDGQPGDATLGLDHYFARDYDTTTGSWVQPDEWRGLLVRPQSLNRFAYVENSPVAFSDRLGFAAKKGGLAAGFGKTNVKKSTTKGGLAAASAAMNMNSLANSVSKVVKSLPNGKVSNPSGESDDWTAASHPPCVYSYQTCESGGPAGGSGNLFGWSDAEWRTAGAVGAGILVGLGVVALAALATGCVVATAGGCAALIAGATVIGSSAAGLTTYTLSTDAKDRTPLGSLVATASGAAGGVLGVAASRALAIALATKVAIPPVTRPVPVPFRGDATHIFRDSAGHFAEDTLANRSLIQSIIKPSNLVPSKTTTLQDGTTLVTYRSIQSDGTQVWAEVRLGEITNAGINAIPK